MSTKGRLRFDGRGVGTCGRCGKVLYRSRAEAKAAKKVLHPSEKMHAYPCGDYWHVGHDEVWRWAEEDGLRWRPLPEPARTQIIAMANLIGAP